MIRNIVFDMGQVLIRFEPDLFLNRYSTLSAEQKNLLKKEVYKSVEWVMTDHGILSVSEAADRIAQRLPYEYHDVVHQLVLQWCDPCIPVPGMFDLVKELDRMGYKLYLLSNAGNNQPEYWQKLEISQLFHGTVISADLGIMKPDQRIYNIFTEKFNLKKEECLFIDDSPINIEGAVLNGWNGIIFHGDTGELRVKMNEMGVRCEL